MNSTDLIETWLEPRLGSDGLSWFREQREKLRTAFANRTLHITLGMIPRRLGKADLAPSEAELEAAAAVCPGWDPGPWSVADAARVLVLIETAEQGEETFAERFVDLCRSAEVAELIALYRGLPLYPEPGSLEAQAAEGLRTNMRTVFEAVAHHNPYPRRQFDEARWNQMVLKALFIGSLLDPIQGLDERANEDLARIMCDYAHERWAAGREVSPELWRCVGPFARGPAVEDLARAYASESRAESLAGGLALLASPDPAAEQTLASRPALRQELSSGEVTWHSIAGSST